MRARAVLLFVVVLGACGDNNEKKSAEACNIDNVASQSPSQNDTSEILGACIDNAGALSIAFTARDAGQPITGLTASEMRFTVARLYEQPGVDSQWQSYVNTTETPPAGGSFPSTTPATQATSENSGTLEERANGVYVYKYTTNLKNDTTPVAVTYDPTVVHRVGFEFRPPTGTTLPTNNPVYNFKPDGNAADNTREIVKTETCNECHAPLAAHGGPRTNTDYCVTCHNPGSVDAESGNSVDFKVMVHKIHAGASLPSVQAGQKYVIYGFNNSENDFSTVVFPQPINNCRKCHNSDTTPQGDYWRQYPSMEACGSCHDNISFAATVPQGMTAHPGGPVDNDQACSGCHSPDAISGYHAGLYATAESPAKSGTPVVKYEITDVKMQGQQPIATFRITVDGNPIDLSASTLPGGLSFTNPDNPSARALTPRLQVAWRRPEGSVTNPADYNTWDTDVKLAQPRAVNVSSLLPDKATRNGDGSYTTTAGTLGDVPADTTELSVGMEGLFYYKPADGSAAEELGADSAVTGVDVSGSTVSAADPPRRVIVSIDKCNKCHGRLAAHGDNRANNIQMCVLCHNPNDTDRNRRPTDPTQAVDGLVEQSIDFREMIHKIHTGENLAEDQYVIYGFATPTTGRPVSFKDVRFPGNRANCLTCHEANTFTVPIDQNALATTKLSGDNLTSPMDDSNVSPTGAACAGCHDTPSALEHTLVSPDHYSTAIHGTEEDNCSQCHGAGTTNDVSKVHQISGQ